MAEFTPPEARIGVVIDERFRIVEHLASGGMASVFRAEHIHNRQPFAIKILLPEYSAHPEVSARFQREVQAYRRIRHANVVAATDFGRLDDGCLYMVLEFIKGHDLCELLHRVHPLDQVRAAKIGLQVALALVAAHAAGVVHRDLKPENIMLIERDGDPDYVKVVDFGIAKVPTAGQALTTLGSVFGTPEYMAPEQARGGQVDHRTDLYTVGTVLYEMLVGRAPFESPNLPDIIIGQISKPPPPLPASVDPELAALIMQLLAKDPAQRVQSAGELSQRLRYILARLAPHIVLPPPAAGSVVPQPPQSVASAAARPAVAPVSSVPVSAMRAPAPVLPPAPAALSPAAPARSAFSPAAPAAAPFTAVQAGGGVAPVSPPAGRRPQTGPVLPPGAPMPAAHAAPRVPPAVAAPAFMPQPSAVIDGGAPRKSSSTVVTILLLALILVLGGIIAALAL